jgi:hypothetical protein
LFEEAGFGGNAKPLTLHAAKQANQASAYEYHDFIVETSYSTLEHHLLSSMKRK